MLNLNVVLRDIRSFSGRHVIPVRPLTILIGENSTGKSTFLSALSVIFDQTGFPFRPGFNRPPFELGGFEHIVTSTKRGGERPKDFSIGFTRTGSAPTDTTVAATYRGSHGQVQLSQFLLSGALGKIDLSMEHGAITGTAHLNPDDIEGDAVDIEIDFGRLPTAVPMDIASIAMIGAVRASTGKGPQSTSRYQNRLYQLIATLIQTQEDPTVALAPVRTKPRRTYDEATDSFTPEGDHIPVLLSRIFADEEQKELKSDLRRALAKFGEDSGLFRSVGVRRLGQGPSDPFQVRVSMPGHSPNLTDVGYGVSQSLPLVVESVIGFGSRLLLLQQPEVHLHPRAQAALGTFFVDLVCSKQKQFVIETHSDYLLDRVRTEIAERQLDPESVAFLFFEMNKGVTKVHRIRIDSAGNVVDPPRKYRKFFLDERQRLLTRGR